MGEFTCREPDAHTESTETTIAAQPPTWEYLAPFFLIQKNQDRRRDAIICLARIIQLLYCLGKIQTFDSCDTRTPREASRNP